MRVPDAKLDGPDDDLRPWSLNRKIGALDALILPLKNGDLRPDTRLPNLTSPTTVLNELSRVNC